MEWPEKIGNLLPEKHVTVRITVDQNECRLIEAKV
jgi:tRNA A37 threonylcarbamoyladenosine biosynthesis protein TsaE